MLEILSITFIVGPDYCKLVLYYAETDFLQLPLYVVFSLTVRTNNIKKEGLEKESIRLNLIELIVICDFRTYCKFYWVS